VSLEAVGVHVKRVLSLKDEAVPKLLDKFLELGVQQLSDIGMLEEADLTGYLKPLQLRKLKAQSTVDLVLTSSKAVQSINVGKLLVLAFILKLSTAYRL